MLKRLLAIGLTLSLLRLIEGALSTSQPPSETVDEEASDFDSAKWPSVEETSMDIGTVPNRTLSPGYTASTANALGIAIRQVHYRNPKKLNRAHSCKYCTSSKCHSLDKIRQRLTKCSDKKAILVDIKEDNSVRKGKKHPSGYFDALMWKCYRNYCKNFKSHEFCGLKPSGKTVSGSDVRKQLKKEESEFKELTKKFKTDVVPRFRYKDYMKRRRAIMQHRQSAEKTRSLALNARKDNVKLKLEMQMPKYRRSVFDMYKWGNETKFYTKTLGFWLALNSRLHLAVRTSPLAVEKLMKVMKNDMRRMMKDREAVSRMKKDVSSMEKEHEVYVEAKKWLEEKLDEQEKAVNALKAERRLLNKVGGDLTNVLRRVLDRVQKGIIKVGCEENALANLISEYTT